MTVVEVYGFFASAAPYAYLMAGLYLLYKEVIVLGTHHRQSLSERDKTIQELKDANTNLDTREREARELAWKATDIGQRLANLKEQKVSNEDH